MVPIWGRASALNLCEGWAMKVGGGARRALETCTSGVDTGAVWGLLAPPSAHPFTASLQVRSMIARHRNAHNLPWVLVQGLCGVCWLKPMHIHMQHHAIILRRIQPINRYLGC